MRLVYALVASILSAAVMLGADPKIVPVGGYADLKVEVTKDSAVIWRFSTPPVQKTTDLENGRLIFGSKPGTTITVTALVIDFEKRKVTDTDYTFVFEGTPTAPPPTPKDPPVTPVPRDGLYFLIVRPDGPATARFTKTIGLPEWEQLRAAGHLVKDKTYTDSKAFVTLPANVMLPVVAVLKEGAGSSTLLRVVPLPDAGPGIIALPGQ